MDNTKYQYEGMKWLVELELINHPQVINTIRFNILMVSKQIREVEILMFRENKSMLVLLDLTWIGRMFLRRGIMAEVQDILTQLLPSFRFRVVEDPKIMEMAVAKVKKALTGGTNENVDKISSSVPNTTELQREPNTVQSSESKDEAGSTESVKPNNEEQPYSSEGILPESGSDDSDKK